MPNVGEVSRTADAVAAKSRRKSRARHTEARMRHPTSLNRSTAGTFCTGCSLRPPRWDALERERQQRIAADAAALFTEFAGNPESDCGLAQLLGDKGDLMLTHYARTFDALGVMQARTDKLVLRDFLEPLSSYVSMLELGLMGYR